MMFQCMATALAPVFSLPFSAGVGQAGETGLAGPQDGDLSYAANERPTIAVSELNLLQSSLAQDSLPTGAKVAGETRADGRTLPFSAPLEL